MGKSEDQPLSDEQMGVEKRYIRLADDRMSLTYQFERTASQFREIHFTPKDQQRPLTVWTTISGPPTPGNPTIDDMKQFARVAALVYPNEDITLALFQHVKEIADNFQRFATDLTSTT